MAEAEARKRYRTASVVLKSAVTQANTMVDRNAAAQVSSLTLERKISALDRAWDKVHESYIAVSRLADAGPEKTADDTSFVEDGRIYSAARDGADDVITANQPTLPPAPTLDDEVLFLDDVKLREKV